MKVNFTQVMQRNLRRRIDESDFRSDRKVAMESGVKPPQLHAILNGDMKGGPGVFALANIATTLNTGLDDIMGLSADGRPAMQLVIQMWEEGGRTYEALEPLKEFLCFYRAPTDRARNIKVHSIGDKTMMADCIRQVNLPFAQMVKSLIDSFAAFSPINRKKYEAVVNDYREAAEKGISISIQQLSIPPLLRLEEPLELTYQRLLLACSHPDHGALIATYALPLRPREESSPEEDMHRPHH